MNGWSRAFALSVLPAPITLRIMRLVNPPVLVFLLCLTDFAIALAQPPPQRNPNVSNKALITKSTPGINPDAFKNQGVSTATATLHKLADDYYAWRNENYPVRSSEAGLHTWDDRLTDYSPGKIAERAEHVRSVLDKVRAMKTDNWPKDQRIDWILFRAQLENIEFGDRVLKFAFTNPQVYTDECTNAIFSLLKKEYDTPRKRALAATARLKQMPALLKQGLNNLQKPVKLYAQLAIQSARSIDPLLNKSMMALDVDLSPNEHDELVKARDAALAALHAYADELEKRVPKMVDFTPMGEANYNYYLKHVLLLPLNGSEVEMIGRAELARYRALEALLPDPKLANPDPKRAPNIPPDQESFLKAYESRETEMIDFLKQHNLVTLPGYLGPFQIRQLPDAFKPTSPGGFMNPPGVYDKDPTGFFFIPTYNPESKNFYIPRQLKIRGRSLDMKASRDIFCSSPLQIMLAMKSVASMRTPSSLKAGRFMAKRCYLARGFIRTTHQHKDKSCACRAIAPHASALM
jgi:uncharacterized protein (DUF885 family)